MRLSSFTLGSANFLKFCKRLLPALLVARLLSSLGISLMLFAPPLVSWVLAAAPDCTVPANYVRLSECIGQDNSVVIGGDQGTGSCKGARTNAYIDKSGLAVGQIIINSGSSLKLFDDTAQSQLDAILTLQTTGIQDLGSLEIGSAACPIGTTKPATKVVVTFTGQKTSCGNSSCAGYIKGIEVGSEGASGGTLRMYGLKGVPPNGISWTHLSRPAGDSSIYSAANGVAAPAVDDANVIYTTEDVGTGAGAWHPGDWIVIATTSFSPWESEFAEILIVEPNKNPKKLGASKITLAPKQKLKFYHFGGPDHGDPATQTNYTAGASLNYGVDERAEVGLVSRNIMLTSDADTSPDNRHWGGELRFLAKFDAVSLQGVELQKFGKVPVKE